MGAKNCAYGNVAYACLHYRPLPVKVAKSTKRHVNKVFGDFFCWEKNELSFALLVSGSNENGSCKVRVAHFVDQALPYLKSSRQIKDEVLEVDVIWLEQQIILQYDHGFRRRTAIYATCGSLSSKPQIGLYREKN